MDRSTSFDDALPAVSVVIPTLDRPRLLQRALAAVLDQDYAGQIEALVVLDRVDPADAMTSAELLARLGLEPGPGRTVRVVTNTRVPGLAGARNSGVLAATGLLVAHCDDDDVWLPAKISAQVAMFRARPELVAVGCGFHINHDGRDFTRPASAQSLRLPDFLAARHLELNSSTVMVRRADLLGRVGLVDEVLPGGYAEDYEWVIRASRVGPIACDPRPLARIYWHSDSYFKHDWATIAPALEYLIDKVPEFADAPAGRSRLEGQLAFAYAALGSRKRARDLARTALRGNPKARQAWAALAVSTGVVSADRVVSLGRRVGRGV
jgi:glycosyltransferase involved in cell wall biosynthesis